DLSNTDFDKESLSNSLDLLIKLGFIHNKRGKYKKDKKVTKIQFIDFKDELYERIKDVFKKEVYGIFETDIEYDEHISAYYIRRNNIDLSISGLVMLLVGLGVLRSNKLSVYIVDRSLLDCGKTRESNIGDSNKITIFQLRNNLILKDALGDAAELLAIQYEEEQLRAIGIDRSPERVSLIDVAVGYDIVSFMSVESNKPDKFIEVKSCSDCTYKFYISRNEVEVAKSKRECYFLYLYNRQSKDFMIINDPYIELFKKDQNKWLIDSQVFEVHAINN
nr:DUF3883 domain-containing protein [Candidatus Saccharibacteria bacterium]